MYGPPRNLSGAHLPELIDGAGGLRAALHLLDVTDRTMRRWLAAGDAPVAVLRLLWYASPLARHEAARDVAFELGIIARQRDALSDENARLEALLTAVAAAPSMSPAPRYAQRVAVNDAVTPEVLAVAVAFQRASAG